MIRVNFYLFNYKYRLLYSIICNSSISLYRFLIFSNLFTSFLCYFKILFFFLFLLQHLCFYFSFYILSLGRVEPEACSSIFLFPAPYDQNTKCKHKTTSVHCVWPPSSSSRGTSGGQAVGNFKDWDWSPGTEIHVQSHCNTWGSAPMKPTHFFFFFFSRDRNRVISGSYQL